MRNPNPLSSKVTGLPKGVYYTRNKTKFKVTIYRNGHVKYLGVFPTAEAASEAYQQYNLDYPPGPCGPPSTQRKSPNASLIGTVWHGL